ncbi:hypothetical protein XANCAGTX0491_000617 [Xanthoria calcicola]
MPQEFPDLVPPSPGISTGRAFPEPTVRALVDESALLDTARPAIQLPLTALSTPTGKIVPASGLSLETLKFPVSGRPALSFPALSLQALAFLAFGRLPPGFQAMSFQIVGFLLLRQ